MKEPRWFNIIKDNLTIFYLLIKLENDTANRNAFILLDNSNELFLKYYIQKVLKIQIKDKMDFDKFIKIINKQDLIQEETLDEIQMYHDSRNDLYHDPRKLTASKPVLLDFFRTSKSLYESLLELKIEEDYEKRLFHSFDESLLKEKWNKRYDDMEMLGNEIKSAFGLTPHDHVEILVATIPGYTMGGSDVFKTLFHGALARDPVNGVNVRILEFVNTNEEDSWHDFYLSYTGSYVWHGIVKCFWSKWGEGDRRPIKEIHNLISEHHDKIIYKQIPRSYMYFWRGALDQFYMY